MRFLEEIPTLGDFGGIPRDADGALWVNGLRDMAVWPVWVLSGRILVYDVPFGYNKCFLNAITHSDIMGKYNPST